MVDEVAKRWPKVAAHLAPRLPGDWVVAGRGLKARLIRQPVGWVLVWVGVTRVRREDHPYLIGGATPLVQGPFELALRVGLRSDTRRGGPKTIDFTDPEHEKHIEEFIVRDMLPLVDPWSVDRLAADAEQQFALPVADRHPPLRYTEVPGWRVLRSTGSPLEPARQSVDWAIRIGAPKIRAWYEALIAAWETGGRPAALTYLKDQRAAALTELKVPDDVIALPGGPPGSEGGEASR